MTTNEINIAIAEWCGWKFIPDDTGYAVYSPHKMTNGSVETWFEGSYHTGKRYSPSDNQHMLQCMAGCIPNYCSDLNAIREAVLKLPDNKRWMWYTELAGVVSEDIPSALGDPREWSIALLRTIGKWKEDK